jgi:hypothetical protein
MSGTGDAAKSTKQTSAAGSENLLSGIQPALPATPDLTEGSSNEKRFGSELATFSVSSIRACSMTGSLDNAFARASSPLGDLGWSRKNFNTTPFAPASAALCMAWASIERSNGKSPNRLSDAWSIKTTAKSFEKFLVKAVVGNNISIKTIRSVSRITFNIFGLGI